MAVTPSESTEANRLDRDIVQRCRRGEMGAFEELYKRFGSRLYTVAYRMTGSAADAEDPFDAPPMEAAGPIEDDDLPF